MIVPWRSTKQGEKRAVGTPAHFSCVVANPPAIYMSVLSPTRGSGHAERVTRSYGAAPLSLVLEDNPRRAAAVE